MKTLILMKKKFLERFRLNEFNNPFNRFILFSFLFIVEIVLFTAWIFRLGVPVDWETFFMGPMFGNGLLGISFALNSWRAYQDMKKGDF